MTDSCLPDICIFPHCDFQCSILPRMKKYSLLVKLTQHITNYEWIQIAKKLTNNWFSQLTIILQLLENYRKSKQKTFPVIYLQDHSSQMQTSYVFKITEHNIICNFLRSPKNNQYQIMLHKTELKKNGRWLVSYPVPSALKIIRYCT